MTPKPDPTDFPGDDLRQALEHVLETLYLIEDHLSYPTRHAPAAVIGEIRQSIEVARTCLSS